MSLRVNPLAVLFARRGFDGDSKSFSCSLIVERGIQFDAFEGVEFSSWIPVPHGVRMDGMAVLI